MLLEVCITSPSDARAATAAGAARLELNAALSLGGLTPSPGTITAVHAATTLPLLVMIRPRPGGFVYDAEELRIMEDDAATALGQGADGIVFGILDSAGNAAVEACRGLLRSVHPKLAVFHRAFDHVTNPATALEQLIDLGFHRILTSGGPPTALAGAGRLRALREQAAGRIEILPAGGIRAHNVRELLQRTGCDQVHASLRKPAATTMNVPAFGVADVTDAAAILAMRNALIGD